MIRLSQRARRVGESPTMRVSRMAAELRAQGVDIIDLGAGEPDFPSPTPAVEAARQALADGFTRYTPVAGVPDLREALAQSYRRRFDAPWDDQQVLVTAGAKAALFKLSLVLMEAGHEVILPSPCWPTLPAQICCAGADPVFVPTSKQDGFRIHASAVLAALTDRTRAVLLNTPNNPTGGMIGARDLRRVVEACAQREVLVISDETYERFVYDGVEPTSAASLASEFPDSVVVVGSFSKTYAMTGWRVGYALGPAPVIASATAIQSHAISSVTSFAMVGALAALRQQEESFRDWVQEYQQRRDLLVEGLNQIPGVSCHRPAGAFYAFPDISHCGAGGRRGSGAVAEYLLHEGHVAVVPGAAFGNDDHLRITFACPQEILRRGLQRLKAVLR